MASKNDVSTYKKTNDDWCPNWPDNTVLVSYLQATPDPEGKYFITVSGADDLSMVREFIHKTSAMEMFHKLMAMQTVDMEELYKLGFSIS